MKQGDDAMEQKNRQVDEVEFAATIGIDWADKKHDVCLLAAGARESEHTVIQQTPDSLADWISGLRQRFNGRKVAICLEQSKGSLIYALMNCDFIVLYPINPVTLARYREAFMPSGAKDDPVDAKLLLELITHHREKLKVWKPDTQLTRSITLLSEASRKAVDLQTSLSNQLKALLKSYFPQALELTGHKLSTALACHFLLKWPTFQSVQRARKKTVEKFYYSHNSRSSEKIQHRLSIIENSVPLTTDQAIVETSAITVKMLAIQLLNLIQAIKEYDKKLNELFSQHPDADIFTSLPGAGDVLAPRLLAAFGTDRDRFHSAEAMQNYSGIAPVTERSGQTEWIHRRWKRPIFIHQSFFEFANKSIASSDWARAYYIKQRNKGKDHNEVVRSLAFKWIRIIYSCWKQRVTYNETLYISKLRERGSDIIRFMDFGAIESPVGNVV